MINRTTEFWCKDTDNLKRKSIGYAFLTWDILTALVYTEIYYIKELYTIDRIQDSYFDSLKELKNCKGFEQLI